jgi:hypothetical protein
MIKCFRALLRYFGEKGIPPKIPCLENHWSGYTYVNREQGLGAEGLRKAKESYFPHHMVNQYTITLG